MFTQSKNIEEKQLGFLEIDKKTQLDEIKKMAMVSRDNLYGLSQCVFELYSKCLWSWNSFNFDSPSYTGNENVTSSDRPSLQEDGTTSYFIKILDEHAKELNVLLKQTDKEFWPVFYKKYSHLEKNKINSFFNLINYVSDHMKDLHLGFNNVATMAMVHNSSATQTHNTENTYTKTNVKFECK